MEEINLPMTYSSEAPTAVLRWYVEEHPWARSTTLQQKWMVTTYEDGKAVGMHEDWRNVPTEIAPAPGRDLR